VKSPKISAAVIDELFRCKKVLLASLPIGHDFKQYSIFNILPPKYYILLYSKYLKYFRD
jgi:hypothetical protein